LIADAFGSAVRRWVQAAAAIHNDGLAWELSIARKRSIVS
jgi:predicted RNA polymerase sigma factor